MRPKDLQHRGGHLLDFGNFFQIGWKGPCPAPALADLRRQCFGFGGGTPIMDRDRGAALRQRKRDRAADAPARAGNQRHFTVEFHQDLRAASYCDCRDRAQQREIVRMAGLGRGDVTIESACPSRYRSPIMSSTLWRANSSGNRKDVFTTFSSSTRINCRGGRRSRGPSRRACEIRARSRRFAPARPSRYRPRARSARNGPC